MPSGVRISRLASISSSPTRRETRPSYPRRVDLVVQAWGVSGTVTTGFPAVMAACPGSRSPGRCGHLLRRHAEAQLARRRPARASPPPAFADGLDSVSKTTGGISSTIASACLVARSIALAMVSGLPPPSPYS